jgi:hypothetical protein
LITWLCVTTKVDACSLSGYGLLRSKFWPHERDVGILKTLVSQRDEKTIYDLIRLEIVRNHRVIFIIKHRNATLLLLLLVHVRINI